MKIPTAKDFWNESCKNDKLKSPSDIMIEFTNLHVKEALKLALEEVPYGGSDEVRYEDVVGILKCYPKTNIK